jgi:hypothetical protein
MTGTNGSRPSATPPIPPHAISTAKDGSLGIVSNYARISFNFGPTLLSWMEKFAPDTYRAIQAADQQSISWRSGHGAALAQVYNHIIMPLASLARQTNAGALGDQGFRASLPALPRGDVAGGNRRGHWKPWRCWPRRASASPSSLPASGGTGQENRRRQVEGCQRLTHRPFTGLSLPASLRKRSITLFFYDGPISQAVAFEKLLDSGEQFASRLMSGFSAHRSHPQFVHIATDGETYGHHHAFGEMALGHALDQIEMNNWRV